MAGGGEDRIHRLANHAEQLIASDQSVVFHVPDDRFDGSTAFQRSPETSRQAASLPGDVRLGVLKPVNSVAAIHEAMIGSCAGQSLDLAQCLREITRSLEMPIYAEAIDRGHVHLLIGIPPNMSVSTRVQHLMGKSSYKSVSEFTSLKKRYWGQPLWGGGYWVASSGNVTDEVCRKISRIRNLSCRKTVSKGCYTLSGPQADSVPGSSRAN